MRLLTLDEYTDLPRPAVEWVVTKLIPRPGIVILQGPPKLGKSYLALQLALAVARGEPFVGHHTEKGPVLYLQLDTSESVWRERLKELRESGTNLQGPVYMVHPDDTPTTVSVSLESGRTWLANVLARLQPILIIVDVLRELHHGDENDSTEMKVVGDNLLSTTKGYALLLVHHTRKTPADVIEPDPISAARGSSYITGKADAIWMLYPTKLRVISRFDEPLLFRAERAGDGLWRFPDGDNYINFVNKVVALCTEFPNEPHSKIADIAKVRFGISRATFFRYLSGQQCSHRT